MTITPFDSPMLSDLLGDRDLAPLFSASAEVRAMLITWGALARAQGTRGLIPETAATFLHRATLEVQIDPAGLAPEAAQNGVCVPGLLRATRKSLEAPEYSKFLHWGATSQDIIDTGLALRLRRAIAIIAERLDAVLDTFATLADTHAEMPMAARTYGQIATTTTFGATVAIWGEGLLAARAGLASVREANEIVTLSGAGGTLSVMHPHGPAVRADMARALSLSVADNNPHANRAHIAQLAGWLTQLTNACGKVATDLLLLTRDGSVALGAAGSSSTMPQKANPVGPSVIRALALHATGLNATLQSTAMTWDQRDGAAWFAEWLALPQLVVSAARALDLLGGLQIQPDRATLNAPFEASSSAIFAEAAAFALSAGMPLPEAQARIKTLAKSGGDIILAAGLDPANYRPDTQWGEAPDLARAFAKRVRS